MDPITVECQSCPVRDTHCADCMVTTLLQITPWRDAVDTDQWPAEADPGGLDNLDDLDDLDRGVLDLFVASGLLSVQGARQVQVSWDWSDHEQTG